MITKQQKTQETRELFERQWQANKQIDAEEQKGESICFMRWGWRQMSAVGDSFVHKGVQSDITK